MTYDELLDSLEKLVDDVTDALLEETDPEHGACTNAQIKRFGTIAKRAVECHKTIAIRRFLFSGGR